MDAGASLFSLGVGARLGTRLLGQGFARFQGELALRNRLNEASTQILKVRPLLDSSGMPSAQGGGKGALAWGAGLGLWTMLQSEPAEAAVRGFTSAAHNSPVQVLTALGIGAGAMFWINVDGRLLEVLGYLIRGYFGELKNKLGGRTKPTGTPPANPPAPLQPVKELPLPRPPPRALPSPSTFSALDPSIKLLFAPAKRGAPKSGRLEMIPPPPLQTKSLGWVKEQRERILRTLNNRQLDPLLRSLASDNLVGALRKARFDAVGLLEATRLFWMLSFHPELESDSRWVLEQYVDFLGNQERFPTDSPQVYREAMRLRRIYSHDGEGLNKRVAAATAYLHLLPKVDLDSTVGMGEVTMGKVALEDFLLEEKIEVGSQEYQALDAILLYIEARLFQQEGGRSEGL